MFAHLFYQCSSEDYDENESGDGLPLRLLLWMDLDYLKIRNNCGISGIFFKEYLEFF